MKECFRKIFITFITFFFAFYINASIKDNPLYNDYINLNDKSNVNVIPSETLNKYDNISRNYFNGNLSTYNIDNLSSSFDLRNDSGKRNVPSIDDQKELSLCWTFTTNNVLESFLLKKGYSEYNFSENQIDYVARYMNDSNTFGGPNNIINVFKYWYYGYSPVLEDDFGSYFTTYKDKKLREYLDSKNTFVDVRDALWIPGFDIKEAFNNYDVNSVVNSLSIYNKTIKNHLINYGAIGASIYTDFYNKETNLLYNDGSKNYSDYASSSHAVTIIGWDDNYGNITYNGKTLKGSWLIMNSWGSDTSYFYVSYYDVDIYKNLVGVTDISLKEWDNIYTEYYNKTRNNNVDKFTFYKGSSNEKVTSVKIRYTGSDNKSVSVRINDTTITKELHYGINYFDIDDFYTSNEFIYVYVTNNSNLNYDISVYSENVDSSIKYYVKNSDTFSNVVGNKNKYYLSSKNILSGTNYIVKVIDSYNNDITSKFNIVKNKDLINNYSNFTLILNSKLDDTNFNVNIYSDGYIDNDYDESSIEGSGSLNNPYLIKKVEDLRYLNNSSDYFKLMNNIDLYYDTTNKDGYFYNNTRGFISYDFNGHFDGNNYTISNMYSYNGGLFNKLNNAYISNVKLDNFNIIVTSSDNNYSGILSSYMKNSSINNVEINNSKIESDKYTGTLSGYAEGNIYINNILINSDINGGEYTGGLIGSIIINGDVNISNTFINDSNIVGKHNAYTGSLIGYVLIYTSSNNINIYNNNTYTNVNKIIGTLINYNNVLYNYRYNNILENTSIDNFNYYDRSIWSYSNTNSLYLKSFPKNEIAIPEAKIDIFNYKMIDNIIYIDDKNKISDIINNVIIDSYLKYAFYNKKGYIIKDDYIGSGSYLKVSNGIDEKIYYFLVLGDINGDGSVNIVDTMMCANNVLLFNFDNSNMEHIACDVDNNKNINIIDVIKIANYILNSDDGF